eukprot:s946_g5.t4
MSYRACVTSVTPVCRLASVRAFHAELPKLLEDAKWLDAVLKTVRHKHQSKLRNAVNCSGLNAGDQALEDENLDEELRRFWDRYPMDDRATTLLLGCPLHLQRRVIDTFDPKNKQEVDYSRQVTGYIRSLQGEDMAGRKRGYEEDHDGAMVGKRARVDVAFPTEAEIAKFCTRYPIDDRAVDYLLSSDAAVQQKVLSEFRPKVENEPDYSSLVTSLVKKMRAVVSTHSAHTPGSPGPTLERLKEFKDRFPMDERAWDFLLLASGHVQEIVVNEFQPRRPDDAEFSAAGSGYVDILSQDSLRHVQRLEVAASHLACYEDTLVACCQDGSIKLWDLRVGGRPAQRTLLLLIRSFGLWREDLDEPAVSVAVADGICACAVGTSVMLLDTSSGEEIANFEDTHSKAVTRLNLLDAGCLNFNLRTPPNRLSISRPSEDDSLRLAINSEESVERFSFAADGGLTLGAVGSACESCRCPPSEGLTKAPREGQRCGRLGRLRSEEHVQVGSVVEGEFGDEASYDNVHSKYFEGATYVADLKDGKGGHKALVRVSSGFAENMFVTGGEDGNLCLWRARDATGTAGVTAFVRSMSKPHMDSNCISRAKLDGFRERYPMDDRAFEYLCTAGTDLQSEVLRNFAPKNENETDYSRQITAFLNLRSKTVSQGGGYTPREAPPWRLRDGETHPRGSVFANSGHFGHRDDGKGDKGDGKGGGLLRAFRARYPMDDRAFDYLQQAEQNVQEMFLAEFQPKRRGMDDDYSASVTSFLKVVRNKIANSGHAHTNAVAGGDDALLEGFRRRYPMDDRAFEYLCQQREDLRRKVVDTFRPKFEGEADYSSLVTSFIRSCRRW